MSFQEDQRYSADGRFVYEKQDPDSDVVTIWELDFKEARRFNKTDSSSVGRVTRYLEEIKDPDTRQTERLRRSVTDWVGDTERCIETDEKDGKQVLKVYYFPHGDPEASYSVWYSSGGVLQAVKYVGVSSSGERARFEFEPKQDSPTGCVWRIIPDGNDWIPTEEYPYQVGNAVSYGGIYVSLKIHKPSSYFKLSAHRSNLARGGPTNLDNTFIMFPPVVDIGLIDAFIEAAQPSVWQKTPSLVRTLHYVPQRSQ